MTWIVAVTHPLSERRAAAGIQDLGIDVWWPVRRVEIINRHTKKLKVRPVREYAMFPGYLFVRSGERSLDLDGIDGLRGVLCNDGRPLEVSEAEMERVRAAVSAAVAEELPTEFEPYGVGQQVVVAKGPLEGKAGPIEFIRRNTATILFAIMGRATPVVVPLADLRKAAA